ncbi:hypothetical protein EFY79_06710 [Hanamia caeni]|uniref:Uncharacterized protein n=1 Tax=Hanamia caeni TaxID=2294116 RepID=A0A3M9NJE4_9BACT|nr:hypothetical protein [Hanamia caeni]RNI37922.1 hypothetical protein EFY79_06710 [Hanamia caeni]
MYPEALALHSLVRWLVLISLLFGVYRGFKGWFGNYPFSPFDNGVRKWAAIIAQIQLVIGITLYSISPLVRYFLHHFRTALPEREVRFFGMEHAVVMVAAIVVITIGSIKSRRKKTSREKYKTMAIWYSIGLLMILSSMPLPFSPPPFVRRPFFRAF